MARRRNQNLPTQPVEAVIKELSHEGRGVCHVDGKVTFVRGALVGEKVKFVYTKRRRALDEAQALEVLESSADRVAAPCAAADICGGCTLQHLSNMAQIEHKQSVLLEQLKHFGQLQPEHLLAPLLGPSLGYRSKARLGVRYVHKKNRVLVGFREAQGAYVADLSRCVTLIPAVGQKLDLLAQLVQGLSVYSHIPQIEVAAGEDHIGLIFRHLQPFSVQDLDALKSFGSTHGFDIYLQPAGPQSVHGLLVDTPQTLSYGLPAYGLELRFLPHEFTQINYELNQKMVAQALSLLELTAEDRVLDLFCGVGNFSLPMATQASVVIGVEGALSAVQRAQQNAHTNHIQNAQFYCSDLGQDLPAAAPWLKTGFNKLLLDPPRTGADALLSQLPLQQVEKLVYVSCNPATFARDAGALQRFGFRLTHAGVMDMFPHTAHVESIACFVK